jgi:hypothetical protein
MRVPALRLGRGLFAFEAPSDLPPRSFCVNLAQNPFRNPDLTGRRLKLRHTF